MTAPDATGTRWDDAPPTLAPLHALPRSCEALGVCQNPLRECVGACQQIPALPAVDGACDEPAGGAEFDGRRSFFLHICFCVVAGLVVGTLIGAWRDLRPQDFDALADMVWSINSMLF